MKLLPWFRIAAALALGLGCAAPLGAIPSEVDHSLLAFGSPMAAASISHIPDGGTTVVLLGIALLCLLLVLRLRKRPPAVRPTFVS